MSKQPPFNLTPEILTLIQDISWELGNISGLKHAGSQVILRRINSIKTIQASLAIEGNTLTIDQITAILDGKRVVGPTKDIQEARNALEVYANLERFNPLEVSSLLLAHNLMMKDLVKNPGKLRESNVGIFDGERVVHMAPSAKMVPKLISNLFKFIDEENRLPWLIKACVFHYEFEFIHPFLDGNGRIGRLWQHLLLMKEDPIFEFIPVETMVRKNQKEYYAILGLCDKEGESTRFIKFSLEQILTSLIHFKNEPAIQVKGPLGRLEYAKLQLKGSWFSRKEYLSLHQDVSTATASRDIAYGLKENILTSQGTKNQTRYRFNNLGA